MKVFFKASQIRGHLYACHQNVPLLVKVCPLLVTKMYLKSSTNQVHYLTCMTHCMNPQYECWTYIPVLSCVIEVTNISENNPLFQWYS